MNYSDRELLAKTIQAEAGNQGAQGMMAVGNVIMNRLGKGGSLSDVILAPGQFSPWNSVTGYAGGAQGVDMSKVRPSEEAYKKADLLLSGNYEDITGGATHFYNPSISNPAWGRDKAGGDWLTIGSHIFGKAGGYRTGKGRTMEPNQQKRTGLGGLLGLMGQGDEDTGLTPFQRFAAALDPLIMPEMRGGAAIREMGKARAAKAQQNKTIEWLKANGYPEIAAMVSQNPAVASNVMSAILSKKLDPKDKKPPKVVTVATEDGGEVAVQWDDATQSWVPLNAPEGAVPTRKPMTESDKKTTLFQTMQSQTSPVLNQLEERFDPSNIQDAVARATPIAGNFFASAEGQMYTAAAEAWAEGALRIATGAAATPAEKSAVVKTYFAQPGDTPSTIEFKKNLRRAYTEAINASLGRGTDYQLGLPQEFARDVVIDQQQPPMTGGDAVEILKKEGVIR